MMPETGLDTILDVKSMWRLTISRINSGTNGDSGTLRTGDVTLLGVPASKGSNVGIPVGWRTLTGGMTLPEDASVASTISITL